VEFSFSGVSMAQGQTGFCHPVPGVSGLSTLRGCTCPLNRTVCVCFRHIGLPPHRETCAVRFSRPSGRSPNALLADKTYVTIPEMRHQQLDPLLDFLYLAAADPAAWPEFLATAAKLFDTTVAGFIVQPNRGTHYGITTILGMDSDAIRRYNDYYCTTDPWFLAMQERGLREWIGAGTALCPAARFEETEFFNDYWKHSSSAWFQAGIIFQSSNSSTVFTMHRERGQPDFDKEDNRLLRALQPHLRRAVSVHRKISDLRQWIDGLGDVVGALDVGLIGLGAGRAVCFVNAVAEGILRSGDVLAIRDGKLCTCDRKATEALASLICKASDRLIGCLPGGSITICSKARSLIVTVLPVAGPRGLVPDDMKTLVAINDPTAPPQSRERLLAQLFRLTPAETRVVMLLMGGLEPSEIAERTKTTPGTVRFQLKMVYRKMNVSGQTQLVRLVSRLPGHSVSPLPVE